MNQVFEASIELGDALESGGFDPITELKEDPNIIPRLERMMQKRGLL